MKIEPIAHTPSAQAGPLRYFIADLHLDGLETERATNFRELLKRLSNEAAQQEVELYIIGDLFDFGWKANAWNLALLERHASPSAGGGPTRGDYLFVILCGMVVLTAALVPILVLLWLGYSVGRLFAQ